MIRTRTALPKTSRNGHGRPLPAEHDLALSALEAGILRAVSYADIFDFPLKAGEIHLKLVGLATAKDAVRSALHNSRSLARHLTYHQGYYVLAGREENVATRHGRFHASAALWARARLYGQRLARLPFVRLVAVTGALAVNNARPGDDIDYLIVTAPGRLWLCRALTILLVKRAARRGDLICPNYFLTTAALALPEHDLFTAHELLQMVPLFGFDVYKKMLALNPWASGFLPNAYLAQITRKYLLHGDQAIKRVQEKALNTPPGDWLEQWEMKRKIAKFSRQMATLSTAAGDQNREPQLVELFFSAERCKGHFDQHGRQTLAAYTKLLGDLGHPADLPGSTTLAPGKEM